MSHEAQYFQTVHFNLIAVLVIAVGKIHIPVFHLFDPVITDGYFMGVPGQIFDHAFRIIKSLL